MKKKIYIISLLIVAIASCLFLTYNSTNQKENTEEKTKELQKTKVIIIPLDNRPVSTSFVEKTANIGEMTIKLPPKELLGGKVEKGKQTQLISWLKANGQEYDYIILSGTMLFNGGLMQSRSYINTNIDVIETLKDIRKTFPNKKIYAHDSIQRLAPSSYSKDDSSNYHNLRQWAILQGDPIANKQQIEEIEVNIPKETIDNYLEARKHNLSKNLKMIEALKLGYIDFLILTQDDSNEKGIHIKEQNILKEATKNLNESKFFMLPGTDEASLVLLAKAKMNFTKKIPSVNVVFSNNNDKQRILSLEDDSLENIVNKIIKISGGLPTRNNKADLTVYVNTSCSENFNYNLTNDLKQGKAVALIDVSDQFGTGKLIDFNDKSFQNLKGYSAWNTFSNMTGIAISQALSTFDVPQSIESQKYLYERMAKDMIYKKLINSEMNQYLKEINEDNLKFSSPANEFAIAKLTKSKIEQKEYIIQRAFVGSKCMPEVKQVKFPWGRLFEAELTIDCKS